jgi:restriction endonuclease S subunit
MLNNTQYSSYEFLPAGWQWVKLKDVCEFIRGVSFDKSEVSTFPEEGRVPILRAGNIGRQLDTTNDLVWVPNGKVSLEQLLRVGDTAICMSSGSADVVGKTAPVEEEWIGSVGAFCGIVRPKNIAAADFVNFWFRSRIFLDWRDDQARGSNIQNLRFSQLAKLEIPLPSLEEQQRIVGVLTEQMAAVEKARAATEERLEVVKALPAAYLRQVFPKPGDPLPDGWQRVKLGEVLVLRKDIIHPRDNPEGPSVFVGLEHIESNTGRRQDSVKVEMSELTGRKPRFFKGDIVYGYLRPYLNKVWIAEFDGLCSVDQYVYNVASQKINTLYVAYFMRSPLFIENSPVGKTPGWLPRIRTDEVACIEIPLPPLAEQERIAGLLKEWMEAAGKASVVAEEEMETINALPAALLRQAFSGEI